MRRFVLSALVLAVSLGVCRVSPAQPASSGGMKTMAIASFSGYDQMLKAVEMLGKLGNNPMLPMMVDGGIKMNTGGQGLAGLDTKRPWGLIVQTDGQKFPAVGFIPVTDLKKLLAVFEPQIGKPKDDGKGVLEIKVKDQTVYVTEKGGWALISNSPEDLAAAPQDPLKALDGLNESYDLAIRAMVKNIPPELRQVAMAPLQQIMGKSAEKLPNESDEQFALRSKITKRSMEQITNLLNDLDTFQLGIKLDEKSSTAFLEYQITAVPGTKTAQQMGQMKDQKSSFAGFLRPEAALAVNMASKLAEADLAQVKDTVSMARANALKELEKQDLSEADLKQAKQMVGDLMDVIEKTLESGRIDGGMAVMLDAKLLTLVAGAYVAETTKLDSLLRQLVSQLTKENAEAAKMVKLDAETHEEVKFHTVTLPTAMMGNVPPQVTELIGDNLEIVIGIGAQSVYLSAGRDAVKTLKQMITASKTGADQTVPPARLSVAAIPISKAAAALAEGKAKGIAAQIAKLLEQTPGKDHLTITSTPIPNGGKVRIELEPGLLKLIASLPMRVMSAAGGMPPGLGAPAPGIEQK